MEPTGKAAYVHPAAEPTTVHSANTTTAAGECCRGQRQAQRDGADEDRVFECHVCCPSKCQRALIWHCNDPHLWVVSCLFRMGDEQTKQVVLE